jgi:hypothetical protein
MAVFEAQKKYAKKTRPNRREINTCNYFAMQKGKMAAGLICRVQTGKADDKVRKWTVSVSYVNNYKQTSRMQVIWIDE